MLSQSFQALVPRFIVGSLEALTALVRTEALSLSTQFVCCGILS